MSPVKCYHCGRKGHLRKDCHYFKRSLQNNDVKRNLQYINTDNTNEETPKEGNKEVSFTFMAGDFQLDTHGDELVFITYLQF